MAAPQAVEGGVMNVNIRQASPSDAAECGRICYEAFAASEWRVMLYAVRSPCVFTDITAARNYEMPSNKVSRQSSSGMDGSPVTPAVLY